MDDFLKPSLLPKVADPLWFSVDRPCDDDVELTKLEEEHKQWVRIANALKLYRACIELALELVCTCSVLQLMCVIFN